MINLSVAQFAAGPAFDAMYLQALTDAVNADVVVVNAVGNQTQHFAAREVDGLSFTSLPAIYGESLAGMITVGSIDSANNARSSFSHFSTRYVELAAPGAESPGRGIYSTTEKLPMYNGQPYGRMSGTSMSAPMVSGAAGLLIGYLYQISGEKPRAAEVERLLIEGAVKDPALTHYYKSGSRLDLNKLFQQVHKDYPQTVDHLTGNCPSQF